jgi:hypothetical protein
MFGVGQDGACIRNAHKYDFLDVQVGRLDTELACLLGQHSRNEAAPRMANDLKIQVQVLRKSYRPSRLPISIIPTDRSNR